MFQSGGRTMGSGLRNPMYTRRIQAMETKISKGENISDYFIRLKGAFSEASISTIMISLLIPNLPADGSEGKIKQDLLKLFQENPNPSEEDLCLFSNKIKEVESLGLACEYRNINTGRGGVRSVLETKKEEPVKPPYVHYLCGKNHKKGKCDVVCTGCGMFGSYKPEKSWKLNPELKPWSNVA